MTISHVFSTFARAALAVAACAAASTSMASPVNTLTNGGFETPSQGGGYTYYSEQTVGGWTFGTFGSGLAANYSGFNVVNAPGNQAAFLQAESANISQAFDFSGGLFSVSFLAESRAGYGGNIIAVFVDNTVLKFNGVTDLYAPSSSVFTAFTSDQIALGAGQHTLKFIGTVNADKTTFIDDVTITATDVPEPGSLALLAIGALGAAALARRRRS